MKGRQQLPSAMKNTKAMLNPEILLERPEPPDLDEFAVDVWNHTCDMLIGEKLLTAFDLPILKLYCCLSSLAQRFEAYLSNPENHLFPKSNTGLLKQNPFIKQYEDLCSKLLQIGEHFGMTPKARGKVGMLNPVTAKITDPFNDFMKGKKRAKQDINLD